MAEDKYVGSWMSYASKIGSKLRLLFVDLLMENRLESFPYRGQLENILDEMDHAIRYESSIKHYRPEIERLQEALDNVYDIIGKFEEYTKTGFGSHFKDNSRVTRDFYEILEKNESGEIIMKDQVESLKELMETYKPGASPEEMSKKMKARAENAEAKAIVLVLVLSMGFVLLKALSVASVPSTTGFYAFPTGEIAGINFEMLYVITSSMILGIYVLGKAMKKW